MRKLTALPILLILASCSSFGSAERRAALSGAISPPRARIDASLLQPCDAPATTPETASDVQVGRLWARDRAALRECGSRHAALARSVAVLEAD